ncbi:hypothetical protein EGW08_012980 [Elysia chlorotica]|uniref:AIG1-type G domain-containing protein n=1 Tax=Elysia chlorotica TaxID=188477 RepID=A0A3S0ZZZ7_ELYCH|nr:hypothetical protein EGW08_012980 [Elysia chlorotica]
MMEPTDLDLLLIGKTGNGKSALGNAILKRKAFVSKSSTQSVTTQISYEVSEYKGKIIKVVDGPGVGDTRLNTHGSAKLVVSAMEQAIAANTRGYHAFLLVVRFGGRFGEEDQDVIRFLKDIFGQDFVRHFCILVMTCGDNFELDSEETGQTFSQWCSAQTGVFQELLGECNNRIVLFDNYTRDNAKRDAQIDNLLSVVSSLQAQGLRYTDRNFELAQTARHRAVVESNKPVIKEWLLQETSLILQRLGAADQTYNGQHAISSLQGLLPRCDALIEALVAQDRGTGALHDLRSSVVNVRSAVQESLRIQHIQERDRRDMEIRQRDMMARYQREIQLQQQNQQNALAAHHQQHTQARAADDSARVQQQQQHTQARAADDSARVQQQQQHAATEAASQRTEQALVDQTAYAQAKSESDSSWIGKIFGFIRWLFGYDS